MTVCITITSTKGGVGKTTLTASLGALLADLDQQVLLIDADPQPTLSSYYRLAVVAPRGLTDLMVVADTATTISRTSIERLHLVYSDDPDGKLRDWIRDAVDGRVRLKHILQRLEGVYDFILMDTQGAVGPLQDAAVAAADLLLSPIPPEILSAREFVRGTVAMLERLRPMAYLGAPIGPLRGVIYRQDRTVDARRIAEELRSEATLPSKGAITILETVIPASVAYREAATAKQPVHRLDHKRKGISPCARESLQALAYELFPHLRSGWPGLTGRDVDARRNGHGAFMSGKRQPDVRGLLLEGHFGINRDLPAADPLTTTQMILEIDRIQPYDRNPRRELNPRFQDIKASIRAQGGLNNPLTVTRRPGEEHYLVEAGGNTRLTILKELWQETRDSRFQRIHCLFVPWRSESHVLGAHLIENELRGDMPLIDRALAVRALQALLEAESGTRLSQSELQRTLTALGYQISRRQLSRYHYAADVLAPLIPKALAAGFGRYHVDALRSIEGAYRRLFESLPISNTAFEPWFAATLSAVDRAELSLEVMRDTLAQSLAQRSGRLCRQIHAQIEALLKDLPSGSDEVVHSAKALVQSDSEASVLLATNPAVEPVSSTAGVSNDPAEAHAREVVTHSPGQPSHTPTMTPSVLPRREHGAKPPPHQGADSHAEVASELSAAGTRQGPDPSDRDTLRGRAYELAERIAQALEFPDAVQPWPGGYGFILDLPAQPLTDEQAWAGWWLLLGISEQTASTERLALMPKENGLGAALGQARQAALSERVGSPPGLTLLPFYLLQSRQLQDEVFNDFLNLIACCRALRRNHLESELWDCITVEQSQLRAQLSGLGDPGDG